MSKDTAKIFLFCRSTSSILRSNWFSYGQNYNKKCSELCIVARWISQGLIAERTEVVGLRFVHQSKIVLSNSEGWITFSVQFPFASGGKRLWEAFTAADLCLFPTSGFPEWVPSTTLHYLCPFTSNSYGSTLFYQRTPIYYHSKTEWKYISFELRQ